MIKEKTKGSLRNPEFDRLLTESRSSYTQDPMGAIALANKAIDLATAIGNEVCIAEALRARGMAHGAKGAIRDAFADFLSALERSRVLGERKLESKCLHGLALAYFHQGQFPEALEYMYQSIALQRELGDERGLLQGLNNLSVCNGELGNFPEGVANLTEVLQLARQIGDTRLEAMGLCNMGIFKLSCDEVTSAITDLEASVLLFEQIGERVTLCSTLTNLAEAELRRGCLGAAAGSVRRAIGLARALDNPQLEVAAMIVEARVCEERKDLDEAERILLLARQIATRHQAEPKQVNLLLALGELCLHRGDLDRAHAYLTEGLERSVAAEQNKETCRYYQVLSDLYEARGDMAAALEAHRAFYRADKALEKQLAKNRMIAQAARRDVERAQQESEIQRLQNVELLALNREKSDLLQRLQRQTDRLAREAVQDPLTGLYNRRYLNDFLEREMSLLDQGGARLTIAIADLDNFKRVNDLFSHRIGDEVLKAVARLFEQTVRRQDVVARYGGEEFVIVLPDAAADSALVICERVRLAVQRYDWQAIHPGLEMTISIGISAEEHGTPEDLLASADHRLYAAKRDGKNRVV